MLKMMKCLVLICCILGCGLSSVRAQHYIFIESDGQAFYVKKAGKLYSSSANGFLIIPKLADSIVMLNIGFPRNQYPELNFEFALMDRDRGFQLRKLDDKGWILFDRSSMETIEVGKLAEEKKVEKKQEKNGFADVLMEVTGDSTLVTKSEIKKSEEKESPLKEVVKSKPESPVEIKQIIAVVNNNKEEQVEVEIDKSEKPFKSKPVEQELQKSKPKEESKVERKEDDASKSISQKKEEKGMADTGDLRKVERVKDIDKQEVKKGEIKSQPVDEATKVNSGKSIRVCSSPFANDKDVKALKKKIVGIVSDQDIIEAVIKAMGERCYNCRQLAELSWMFTDEQVRLKLFQRAYTWVSDPEKFLDLETTLVQDNTIAAFRKIISQSN